MYFVDAKLVHNAVAALKTFQNKLHAHYSNDRKHSGRSICNKPTRADLQKTVKVCRGRDKKGFYKSLVQCWVQNIMMWLLTLDARWSAQSKKRMFFFPLKSDKGLLYKKNSFKTACLAEQLCCVTITWWVSCGVLSCWVTVDLGQVTVVKNKGRK